MATASGVMGGAMSGAATGSMLGPWGAAGGAVLGGVMGAFGGDDAEGPDLNAINVNNNASMQASTLQSEYSLLNAREQFMPMMLAYAGYSKDQIANQMTTARSSFLNKLIPAHQQINGAASGSGAQHGLQSMILDLQAKPLPDIPDVKLTAPFSEKFEFKPVETSALYKYQMDQGNKAINQNAAARGNLNSRYNAKTLSDFASKTGAEETERQYSKQQWEFGTRASQNELARADEQARFGRLMGISNISEGAAQYGAGLEANAAARSSAATQNLSGISAQVGSQNQQFNSSQANNNVAGGLNSLVGAVGAYQNQQFNNRYLDILSGRQGPVA